MGLGIGGFQRHCALSSSHTGEDSWASPVHARRIVTHGV